MAVLALLTVDDFEQTDQSNSSCAIAMPNPKSPAVGSSNIPEEDDFYRQKALDQDCFSFRRYLGLFAPEVTDAWTPV